MLDQHVPVVVDDVVASVGDVILLVGVSTLAAFVAVGLLEASPHHEAALYGPLNPQKTADEQYHQLVGHLGVHQMAFGCGLRPSQGDKPHTVDFCTCDNEIVRNASSHNAQNDNGCPCTLRYVATAPSFACNVVFLDTRLGHSLGISMHVAVTTDAAVAVSVLVGAEGFAIVVMVVSHPLLGVGGARVAHHCVEGETFDVVGVQVGNHLAAGGTVLHDLAVPLHQDDQGGIPQEGPRVDGFDNVVGSPVVVAYSFGPGGLLVVWLAHCPTVPYLFHDQQPNSLMASFHPSIP
mmetsp:Transcript_32938/g.52687  ORF Transcript_32938/g.52687 Transcript_32938/m.52687 type:complete len:292 (+) Transcript_32938:5039-5914(+)